MSSEIPYLDSTLTGIKIEEINGFRNQEDWGRWTLGKFSQINVKSENPTWIESQINIGLPIPYQDINIALNGKNIAYFGNLQQPLTYNLRLALYLRAGDNFIQIATNKSNYNSPPFAPKDLSDIGMSISKFSFYPIQPFTQKSAGHIYNILKFGSSPGYIGAAGSKVQLFVQTPAAQVLNYRILNTYDWQSFQIQFDNQTLAQLKTQKRGTLTSGQTVLPLDKKLHVLSITTGSIPIQGTPLRDSIGHLKQYNGDLAFYIQEIRLETPHSWQFWQRPTAVGISLLILMMFAIWLFRVKENTILQGQ